AEDFVFTWRMYTNPEFGLASATPQGLMDEVLAPDARTVTIRWKRAYPFAGVLGMSGSQNSFAPLAYHALGPQSEHLSADALLALPFWTAGYVGAGPFTVERWEPGAFIDATAFEGHALGRPK